MTPERWSEVERLYHAAAARELVERSAFLTDACGEDDALREDVESLLALDVRAEAFLSTPAFPSVKLGAGPSAIGQHLGQYTVHALLGAGGMGDVYRAHDGALGRDVAIKVLPPAFTSDPDRLARFDREARILASLNHPHIGAIYGLEKTDGIQALVLELVEGPTLADRLGHGPVPIAESLDIARQIAEALEATHGKGIVHRDLKPANIKITAAGVVKVLDFGLAQAEVAPASDRSADTAARVDSATGSGVLVGTAPYMSPEQVRGKPTDNRTDVWAFGCVLFEMLTGRGPFAHETQAETLAAILDRDPDWATLPEGTTPAVRRILRRCLQKDPRRRAHAIADVRIDLEDALSEPSSSIVDATRKGLRSAPRARFVWAAALVSVGAGLLLLMFIFLRPVPIAPSLTYEAYPPDGGAFKRPHDGAVLAVSPDGATIAFLAAVKDGKQMIWLRVRESLTSRVVPGTEGADGPFWNPDSQSLGFFADGKIQIVSIRGGPPQSICEDGGPTHQATWNSTGDILFVAEQRGTGGLKRVKATGGPVTVETLVDRAGGETGHLWPYFLPDGRHFVYVVTTPDGGGIDVRTLGTTQGSRLLGWPKSSGVSSLAYGSPGYLLFANGGTLMAQAFDAARLQTSGEPVRVAEGVLNAGAGTGGAFSVSTSGVLAYWGGDAQPTSRLVWFERDGRQSATAMPIDNYGRIALDPSDPSGSSAAVEQLRPSGNPAIFLVDLQQGTKDQFTSDVFSIWPIYSPDGASVAFSSMRDGTLTPYRQAVGARENATQLFDSIRATIVTDWSDDNRIVYQSGDFPHDDIGVFTISQAKAQSDFLRTPAGVSDGRVAPGGRWMAYVSAGEVFVTSFPDRVHKVHISTAGGEQPRWGRDDSELYYLADKKVMAVRFAGSPTLGHSNPTPLFDAKADNYAVTKDGRRFLLVIPTAAQPPSRPFTVVVNWATALQK
jgi:Tol biopolymer transport system component